LNIVVCVKQVPDPYLLKFNLSTKSVEDFFYIINPYDRVAVEEAVRIRERTGVGEVTAVTVGPPDVEAVLRTSLTMGADKAIHVNSRSLKNLDAGITAAILARMIGRLQYDLVLCGRRSLDEDNGYVGASIAEQLGLPLVSGVAKVEVSADGRKLTAYRCVEKGDREVVECPTPALLTVDDKLNDPRYPSLPTYIAGLRKKIIKVEATELMKPQEASPATKILTVTQPKPRLKKGFSIGSSLSASERIKLILSGGVKEKGMKMLEEKPELSALEVVRFLQSNKIVAAQKQ